MPALNQTGETAVLALHEQHEIAARLVVEERHRRDQDPAAVGAAPSPGRDLPGHGAVTEGSRAGRRINGRPDLRPAEVEEAIEVQLEGQHPAAHGLVARVDVEVAGQLGQGDGGVQRQVEGRLSGIVPAVAAALRRNELVEPDRLVGRRVAVGDAAERRQQLGRLPRPIRRRDRSRARVPP